MRDSDRRAVVAETLTWIGTPYHHHARIKGVGTDCAQILCEVYEACGLVEHVETGFYPTDWHLHRSEEMYAAWLTRYCTRLPEGLAPQPGDISLFKFGRCFSHGAIVVDGGLLVHAYIGRGVILSAPGEEPLEGRPVQHWTIK